MAIRDFDHDRGASVKDELYAHSVRPLANKSRKIQASLISSDKHRPSSRSIAAFPSYLSYDLGLALMNLELHGCVRISAANELCELGLVSPFRFAVSRSNAEALVFEAIETDLQAILEIGRIAMASTVKHPFIAEAFARMQIDQFATEEHVVFDQGYLSRCGLEMQEAAFARSARRWRRQDAAGFQDLPG